MQSTRAIARASVAVRERLAGRRAPSTTLPTAHFLHIGKTGGTAVRNALAPYRDAGRFHLEFHPHAVTLGDVPEDDGFVFIVRDPLGRFVSGFYSRQRQGRPRYDQPWNESEREAFARFATANALGEALGSSDPDTRRSAEAAMRGIRHVKSSHWDWLVDDQTLRRRSEHILFIGFQDRLSAQFPALVDALGIAGDVTLPGDDHGAHRNPEHVDRRLSDEAVENLRRWYARDFELIERCRELAAERGW